MLKMVLFSGYSGGHVSTVGSVVITNLKTGVRTEGLDTAEVICCACLVSFRYFIAVIFYRIMQAHETIINGSLMGRAIRFDAWLITPVRIFFNETTVSKCSTSKYN